LKNFLKKNSISSGAIIIALFTILSKILGLLRYSLIAAKFGTGPIADAYMAAFRIPDFIYNILILGALSTAVIPVFLDLYHKKKQVKNKAETPQDLGVESSEEGLASVNIDHHAQIESLTISAQKIWQRLKNFVIIKPKTQEKHWDLISSLLNTLLLLLIIVAGIVFIFVPNIVPWLVPGFDLERTRLTIRFTRIILLSPIIFAVSNLMGSVLQAFRRFLVFALAPVLYNIGIIIGILVFYPWFGSSGLAFGVVLGVILHLLVQFPWVCALGFSWRPIFAWQVKEVRRVLRLILPRALALSGNQVNHLVNTWLASQLMAGSVVIFYNAYDLEILPIGLVAVSLAVASFPVLGEYFIQKNDQAFEKTLLRLIRIVLLIMIPLSLFMFLLRAQIVRLVLGYGKYNWTDTVRTLNVFGVFCLSLVPQALVPVFSRAFYARENTKTPVIISLFCIAFNIILALFLVKYYALYGLAMAFSTSSLLQALLLWFCLSKNFKALFSSRLLISIFKFSIAALGAGFILYFKLYLLANFFGNNRVWSLFLQSLLSFIIGVLIYFSLLWILKEQFFLEFFKKFKKHGLAKLLNKW